MLTATKLTKRFGGVAAVHGASFVAEKGQITALIGPNGAGKTTLFNLISGTMLPDEGRLELDGQNITSWPCEERARHGLSRTFQLSRPFKNLTVGDHLKLALDQEDDSFWKSLFRRKKDDEWMKAKMKEVLEAVGLDRALDTPAADLSYGQGKLLGLAMALIHPHKILLLDEPVAGVNPVIRERISHVLNRLREEGETILIIEHDMEFIMPLADHVVVLDRGAVIAHGTSREIQKDPDVLAAYLGAQL